jgi:hypothetical protein
MNEAKLPPLPEPAHTVWDDYYEGYILSPTPQDRYHNGAVLLYSEHQILEYGALCARQATESIADALSDALQSDLENGVKWLNERASERFTADYPELRKAIAAILSQPQTGGSADE